MLLIGYLLLALVVAAVLFYLVVAFLPAGMSVSPARDDRPLELPANRRMRLADLDRVRIPVSVRGYRFAETDELIDRLAAEIVVRDEEIARLKQQGYPLDADQSDQSGFRRPEPVEPEWAVRDLGEPAASELVAVEPSSPDPDPAVPDSGAASDGAVPDGAARHDDARDDDSGRD